MRKSILLIWAPLAFTFPIFASATDGYFDPTWRNGGRIVFDGDFHNPQNSSHVARISADPNGELLIGGYGSDNWWIGKFSATGYPVPTFAESNGSGVVTGCSLSPALCNCVYVNSLALMNDGKIVVLAINGQLVRVGAGAHALDTTSVVGGVGYVSLSNWQFNDVQGHMGLPNSIIPTSSGGWLVAGSGFYSAAATNDDLAVFALRSDFSLDTAFNAGTDANGATFFRRKPCVCWFENELYCAARLRRIRRPNNDGWPMDGGHHGSAVSTNGKSGWQLWYGGCGTHQFH